MSDQLDEELTEIHPGFLWNDDSKASFENCLQTQKTSEKVNSLLNRGDISPISLAASIKEIIFETINDAKVKAKKSSNQQ